MENVLQLNQPFGDDGITVDRSPIALANGIDFAPISFISSQRIIMNDQI